MAGKEKKTRLSWKLMLFYRQSWLAFSLSWCFPARSSVVPKRALGVVGRETEDKSICFLAMLVVLFPWADNGFGVQRRGKKKNTPTKPNLLKNVCLWKKGNTDMWPVLTKGLQSRWEDHKKTNWRKRHLAVICCWLLWVFLILYGVYSITLLLCSLRISINDFKTQSFQIAKVYFN